MKKTDSAKSITKELESVFSFKFSDSSAIAYLEDLVGELLVKQLSDANWKTRLESCTQLSTILKTKSDVECEAVCRALLVKPSLSDNNLQVVNAVLEIIETRTQDVSFEKACVSIVVPMIIEKLGDQKVKKNASSCLSAMSESTSFGYVLSQSKLLLLLLSPFLVYEPMKKVKNPKNLIESLNWILQAHQEFGTAGCAIKEYVECIKMHLGNTNQTIRNIAVQIFGQIKVSVGISVRNYVSDLSAQLLAVIDAEFMRVDNQESQETFREQKGLKKHLTVKDSIQHVEATESKESMSSFAPQKPILKPIEKDDDALETQFPRIDISEKLDQDISSNLMNANWKIRKEGLDAISTLIESANKRIKTHLGGLN